MSYYGSRNGNDRGGYNDGRRGSGDYGYGDRRGGGGGGGYGNHGGRGRGGGGGGGRYGRAEGPPPGSQFPVRSNCFQVSYQTNANTDARWFHYLITVTPRKMIREKDRLENGSLPSASDMPEAHPQKVERFQSNIQNRGSTSLSREIMKNLCDQLRNENMTLVTDGAFTGYSPHRLFQEDEKVYDVTIDKHPYQVTLTFVADVPLAAFSTMPATDEEFNTTHKITQCLDTIFKDAMHRNLITFGKNPNTFFLPEENQTQLLRNGVFNRFYQQHHPTPYAPFIGISQSAQYCSNGKVVVAVNNKVEWMYRAGERRPDGFIKDIPLLDERRTGLAGIQIHDLHRKIEDEGIRNKIQSALAKIRFTVKYTKGQSWVENSKQRGRSQEYIEKYRTKVMKEQRLYAKEDEPRIYWACGDHTFEKKSEEGNRQMNVAQYFQEIYGVRVRFPNMPVVSVNGKGYFPVEFLFQEPGRVSGANDADKVTEVLKYHDTFAGTDRIAHVQQVKGMASDRSNLTKLLEKFSISVDHEPVKMTAKRLQAPPLEFANNDIEGRTSSGSWNLRDKRFKNPAPLYSFAVVDLGHRHGKAQAHDVMNTLFQTMTRHGMSIENFGAEGLDRLTVKGDPRCGPEELHNCFREAIARAKEYFLSHNFYNECRLGFTTNVLMKDGGGLEVCIVTRGIEDNGGPPKDDAPLYAIPVDRRKPTHTVINRENDTMMAKARIKFEVQGQWVDPVNLAAVNEIKAIGYRICDGDGNVRDDGIMATLNEVANATPLNPVEPWQYQCPSIVFFYIPEKRTDIYDCIKALSDLEFGINTQCMVQETCNRQNRMEQYCSNVALKDNTKLFSITSNACAWEVKAGLEWIYEEPTMVMGYSLSHGKFFGKTATAVGGSVCLNHAIQTAQDAKLYVDTDRTGVVNDDILKSLTTSLAAHYFQHCGNPPKRMIVFRDGGSDGNFQAIQQTEVSAIREAIDELNERDSEDPESAGCKSPRITFVVAQNDHNMRIVPQNHADGVRGNVPSGTLVDDYVTAYGGSENPNDAFDFLLTPQGGLKGTSKPMHYRVLLNENANLPSEHNGATVLTKEKLQDITYAMAFQYGTATKAPRKIPVLLNSDRLATRVMKYSPYTSLLQQTSLTTDEDTEEIGRAAVEGTSDGLYTSYNHFDRRVTNENKPNGWKCSFGPHIAA